MINADDELLDIFKLAIELDFDCRGAKDLKSHINAMIIVNEEQEKIENFNSNKVIIYNKNIDFECII